MIIGITGLFGSGKDTVAEYLVKQYNFKHYSLSDFIRQELVKRNKKQTRENLQQVGNELREMYGPAVLAQKAHNACKNNHCVLTSIRNSLEVKFLAKQKDFILWNIKAPAKLRFQRMMARQKESEQNTTDFESFAKQEKKELKGDKNSQNLSAVICMAGLTIKNDCDILILKRRIDEAVEKLPKNWLG